MAGRMRAVISPRPLKLLATSRPSKPSTYLYCSVRRSSSNSSGPEKPATENLSPRWLSDVKQRIGKCITFGLDSKQKDEAGSILQEIARDWRELVAGSEGFLTGPKRRGLFRHRVVWGEEDSMVYLPYWTSARYAVEIPSMQAG